MAGINRFVDGIRSLLRTAPDMRPRLQPFLEDPSLLKTLPPNVRAAIESGDPQAIDEAMRIAGKGPAPNYTVPQGPSGPGQLVPSDPVIVDGTMIPAGPRGLSVPGQAPDSALRGELVPSGGPGPGVPVDGPAGGPGGRAGGELSIPDGRMRSPVLDAALATGLTAAALDGTVPEVGPEDLADGLSGAPQDDIAPEPMAGTPNRAAVMNNASPAAAPSRAAQPGDSPLAPPHVMTQADIDYADSLPYNSPEAKAARQRRYEEEDARLAEAEGRMEGGRARLNELRQGAVPSSFDPGTLSEDERLPSVGSARPQSYANPNTFDPMAADNPRQAFRDFERAEDMRRRSMGMPVEAQRERDFASGQLGDFDERLAGQSRFARAAQFDPNVEFGPNDFQRRYNPEATAEWNQRISDKIRAQAREDRAKYDDMQEADRNKHLGSSQWSDSADNLFDAKAERADLESRVKNYARQNNLSYDDALSALQAEPNSPFLALSKSLPDDRYTGLERKSGQRKRLAAQVDRRDEQALRRERIATAGLLGISQPQANAFLMLSPEDRNRAVNYITNPMAAKIDLARAQKEVDPLASMQAALARGQADRANREANPMEAGKEDAKEINFTDEADSWIDSHAQNFDNTTGGFSNADEVALRKHFMALGFSPEAATEAAKRGANRRRRWWMQQGRPAPETPTPPELPQTLP